MGFFELQHRPGPSDSPDYSTCHPDSLFLNPRTCYTISFQGTANTQDKLTGFNAYNNSNSLIPPFDLKQKCQFQIFKVSNVKCFLPFVCFMVMSSAGLTLSFPASRAALQSLVHLHSLLPAILRDPATRRPHPLRTPHLTTPE